jgi:hypothetical protein
MPVLLLLDLSCFLIEFILYFKIFVIFAQYCFAEVQ